jgi:hypothetical protein
VTTDARRPGIKHPRLTSYALIGIAGVASSLVLARFEAINAFPHLASDPGLVGIGLGLGALLLIPPSILAAGVGTMFPRYDRATPVTLVNDPTYGVLLGSVTFGLFLGVSIQVFGLQKSPLPLGLFGIVLAIALLVAVWLISHSLAVLDPDRMSAFLADRAVRHPFLGPLVRPDPNQPFKDLCRLTRGYLERQRPSAAANAIDQMTAVWRVQGHRLDRDAHGLAARVLGESLARRHWTEYLQCPIDRFVAASRVEPNRRSEVDALARLEVQEPWLFPRSPRAESPVWAWINAILDRWIKP